MNTSPTDSRPESVPCPAGYAAPVGASITNLRVSDLRASGAAQARWLWHGFLAPGNVTLLTSQWKAGKTTLVAVLLARMAAGGSLLGLPLAPGKAVVVTEESPARWAQRAERLGLGEQHCWICRPFARKPSTEQWGALLDHLAQLHAGCPLDLVVIDPLASFLPAGAECHAGAMVEHLLPVQALAARGPAVLLLHHPRKGDALAGQAARGTGSLAGFVDVLVEMHWYRRGAETDRRRRLEAWSRFDETPRQLVIELNAAGTDYVCHGAPQEEAFAASWLLLRDVLAAAPRKLTRAELLQHWPPDARRPSEESLWRWLDQAVERGWVRREGAGRKNSPYRYWLPGIEEKWLDESPEYVMEVLARAQGMTEEEFEEWRNSAAGRAACGRPDLSKRD